MSSFGFTITDRLKAAVNSLEATGTSLQAQARASISQAQSGSTTSSRPQSPNVAKTPNLPGPTGNAGVNGSPGTNAGAGAGGTTGSPSSTTSPQQYLSQAGDAFTGLRKSFGHFSRTSIDNSRPSSNHGTPAQPQELKDISSTPLPEEGKEGKDPVGSRPASPGKYLNPLARFELGSAPSSMGNTPRVPSPNAAAVPLPQTPLNNSEEKLPPPDPSDPATYPLPPSPTLSPSTMTVPNIKTQFDDPLGASPLLPPIKELGSPEALRVSAEDSPDELETSQNPNDTKSEASGSSSNMQGLGIRRRGDTNGETVAEAKDEEQPREPETLTDAVEPPPKGREETVDTEKRYQELSQQYTTIMTQKNNADKVLRDLTPLEGGIADHEALEGWVRMMKGKVDMITEEMTRLQRQIQLQDSRIQEVRDTHRLEATSQTELVAKLRTQLSTAESNVASKAVELMALSNLRADLGKSQTLAKEEEEKRTKAISLLKTVRMKLVKVEKEKEEIERDRAEERAERSTAKDELERYRAEREREVTALRKGFDRELTVAKDKYEKELQARKGAWELEMITTKASHAKELSGKSTKVTGLEAIVKELNLTKQQQFEDLQSRQAEVESSRVQMESLRTRTKELEFQLREANERYALLEESSAGPSMSSLNRDRGRQHLGVGSRSTDGRSATPSPTRGMSSSVEVQRLLAESEARSESKMAELRNKVRSLEVERNEAEEEWAVKLGERVREMERLKRVVQERDGEYADSVRTRREKERLVEEGTEARKGLDREIRNLKAQLEEGKEEVERILDLERSARDEVSNLSSQTSALQSQLDDSKTYSTNLKSANKTLRDELRKVQSSVQLMERQRNPGVGYWSSAAPGMMSSSSIVPVPRNAGMTSPTMRSSGMMSPTTRSSGMMSPNMMSSGMTHPDEWSGTSTPTKERKSLESGRSESLMGVVASSGTSMVNGTASGAGSISGPTDSPSKNEVRDTAEEEVNLEYLRNVILQFLEHKEMRPNLVRVLSVILRFTPQELRRLNAKLQS